MRFFASRVYDGALTTKVKVQFLEITTKALKLFLNDSINDRLKSAIGASTRTFSEPKEKSISEDTSEESKVITTFEEIEGFNIVKAILRKSVDVKRIIARDTQSYFGILLDDNNRKPLCRLHFNTKQKYIGIFDAEKNETRHPIESLDDIFSFTDALVETSGFYS